MPLNKWDTFCRHPLLIREPVLSLHIFSICCFLAVAGMIEFQIPFRKNMLPGELRMERV